MFCKGCGSLLARVDGQMACPNCKTQQRPGKGDKQITVVAKREEKNIKVIDGGMPTLPTTDAECTKCGNTTAFWRLVQTRAADEPETRIFRCTKCGYTWREY
jgi:DNA-directed RNA polymerase subunit M